MIHIIYIHDTYYKFDTHIIFFIFLLKLQKDEMWSPFLTVSNFNFVTLTNDQILLALSINQTFDSKYLQEVDLALHRVLIIILSLYYKVCVSVKLVWGNMFPIRNKRAVHMAVKLAINK